MEEVVKGVWLSRAGEFLEAADLPTVQMQLVASWDGTEVMRQLVRKGGRFGLRPEEGWAALEHLHIVQGHATWEQGDETIELGPGDSLTGRPVQEPCILRAMTDLVAIYVCSQPVFHQMSNDLAKLIDLAVQVEAKDGYTADHCERIQRLSAAVGKAMNLSPVRLHYLIHGAFLHDLGKVRVPDDVLKKPGKLTEEEWDIMRKHTVFGHDMLLSTAIAGAAPILLQHHERVDGSGYPYGLKGDEICLEAQIVAVVDSYDAMTTDRVYRPALGKEKALAELRTGIDRLYRADVVETFISTLEHLTESGYNSK